MHVAETDGLYAGKPPGYSPFRSSRCRLRELFAREAQRRRLPLNCKAKRRLGANRENGGLESSSIQAGLRFAAVSEKIYLSPMILQNMMGVTRRRRSVRVKVLELPELRNWSARRANDRRGQPGRHSSTQFQSESPQ